MSTAKVRLLSVWILIALQMLPSLGNADDKSKQRIQELFIWKVSDYLELSPEEDTNFRTIFKELNEKKSSANEALRQTVEKMEKEKNKAKKANLTKEYEKHLKEYTEVQLQEINRLGKLLGNARLADYIIIKTKLTENLKVLIGSGKNSSESKLEKPKVVIEN